MEIEKIIKILKCPSCKGGLELNSDELKCHSCGKVYLLKAGIPVLLTNRNINNKYEMDYLDHYTKDAEIFDYFAEREFKATEHDERRLREFIVSVIPKGKLKIMDAGSGGAWAAEYLAEKSEYFVSFDISDKNIKSALKKYNYKNHYGIIGDALNPPIKDNSFDLVISSEVIEHIVDPRLFLNNLLSLVKPAGKLIISTPYKETLSYSQCIHCNRMTPKNAHLHSFDENILKSLAEKELTGNIQYFIFGNKALTVLRTHVFLGKLPLALWKLIDSFANLILKKQAHIIMIYTKK